MQLQSSGCSGRSSGSNISNMAPVSIWCCALILPLFACFADEIIVEPVDTTANVQNIDVESVLTKGESLDAVDNMELNAQVNDTATVENSTEAAGDRNDSATTTPIRCLPRNESTESDELNKLLLVNGTALLQELTPANNKTNTTAGQCVVVAFYSPYCNFCAKAAPYVNALPFGFPDLKFYAVDVVKSSHINMRYGLVAVPSILLFHNGRAVAKFNDSLVTMQGLITFISRHTGMSATHPLDPDYTGPLADVPLEYTDWVLISAWVFTIVCFVGVFLRSNLCKRMTASVQNAWREAQHQHQD